jgi:hypothetical protein
MITAFLQGTNKASVKREGRRGGLPLSFDRSKGSRQSFGYV